MALIECWLKDGNLDTILQSELAVARERRKKQPLTVLEFFNLIQNVRNGKYLVCQQKLWE